MDFSNPLMRFATSGLLISLYGMADHLARRASGDPMRASVTPPRTLRIAVAVCLLAFYLLIRPLGGPVLGGAGNVTGIALALFTTALRYATRKGTGRVREPEMASRILLYVALPLAVGVPLGWLVLTLPAVMTSLWWCGRRDALLVEQPGRPRPERAEPRAHWTPKAS